LRRYHATPEAGLISSQDKRQLNFGSAGRPIVNTEVRIAKNGELLVRSDSLFSGYDDDPQKTAGVMIDGWLHTGDAANIDEKGHLILLNRKIEDKREKA
jgi:long-chain acyl-CoA synthetase